MIPWDLVLILSKTPTQCVPRISPSMSFESANTNLQLIENRENRLQLFWYSDGKHVELNFARVEGLHDESFSCLRMRAL